MNNRKIAIINFCEDRDVMKNIITKIDSENEIYVFCKNEYTEHPNNVQYIQIPFELVTRAQVKNFVTKYFYETLNFRGFLHIIEDSLLVDETKVSKFMNDLEIMMDYFDYDVWMNTITDRCNYVYSKYNPRLKLDFDSLFNIQDKLGIDKVFMTSHSNTAWMCYNLEKVKTESLYFDERFAVPMFYILEFLSRRKKTRNSGQPFYMNMYMTVESEKGTFTRVYPPSDIGATEEIMKNEDKLFREELKVDVSPDNNVDSVLTEVISLIAKKEGINL